MGAAVTRDSAGLSGFGLDLTVGSGAPRPEQNGRRGKAHTIGEKKSTWGEERSDATHPTVPPLTGPQPQPVPGLGRHTAGFQEVRATRTWPAHSAYSVLLLRNSRHRRACSGICRFGRVHREGASPLPVRSASVAPPEGTETCLCMRVPAWLARAAARQSLPGQGALRADRVAGFHRPVSF